MTTQQTQILTTAVLLSALLSPVAAANDAVTDGAWTLPAWTANDQPIEGSFHGEAASDAVRIRFRLNEGDAQDAAENTFVEAERRVDFTLPSLDYDAFGRVQVWAEDPATGEPVSPPAAVGVADWHEFDITGQTAVELLFPMESWDMQVRFTPCCLILGGYLRVERVPVNPVGNAAGLPASLASHFLHLAPDPTVVATSGLNADIGIDPGSPYVDKPESLAVYRWFKGQWTPVHGVEVHAETNTLRFKALEGGFFVLGPKPEAAA